MSAIALIAALDRRRAIGRDNTLPWHLPEDLRRFKRLTLDHAVLMGRKTAQSIGRALPGRRNLVLTRTGHAPYPDQIAVDDIERAIELADERTLYVIGGGEVYRQCLDRAERMHLTWVETEVVDADTWFPDFDPGEWRLEAESTHEPDHRHPFRFRFTDYRRKR